MYLSIYLSTCVYVCMIVLQYAESRLSAVEQFQSNKCKAKVCEDVIFTSARVYVCVCVRALVCVCCNSVCHVLCKIHMITELCRLPRQ